MEAVLLLLTPLITSFFCFWIAKPRIQAFFSLLGATLVLLQGLWLVGRVFYTGTLTWFNSVIYLDALGAYVLGIISILTFTVSWYSVGYMAREVAHGIMHAKELRKFYCFLYIFIATMLATVLFNSLGIVWVAVEATTLVSALLVGFYRTESSLEAAWKYIIICTVGICFALFGVVLIYYGATQVLGEGATILYWSVLMEHANEMDQGLVKLGFIFVLVGYGTKVGLAPMHTWLPDAHSEAPTPVSALLSGGLLNCAFYAILRYHILTVQSVGIEFSSKLLLLFGIVSIAVAVPFVLIQSGLKRLLAYSSVKHMGVIAIGIGVGGKWGYYGAMLHMLNHSLTKSAIFLLVGNIVQRYRTKNMDRIRGVLQTMPFTGSLLFIGILALIGSPPFGIFVSKFQIAAALFAQMRYGLGAIFLILLALVFTGLMYYFGKMIFGKPSAKRTKGDFGLWSTMPALFLLSWIIVSGIFFPDFADQLISKVVLVLEGSVIVVNETVAKSGSPF